ncbi:MOSC domain-containing protein [Oscillospiraceae bacterium WX1]
MAVVTAVCISDQKGVQKHAVQEVLVRKNIGIEGDAHAGVGRRQISLLCEESVEKLRPFIPDLPPGAFAENILTRGIALYELSVGTRLRIGETLLEVSQVGKQCHRDCAIKLMTGDCVMPREGVFAVALAEGTIRAGDTVEIVAPGQASAL